jgi:hypothetical protein
VLPNVISYSALNKDSIVIHSILTYILFSYMNSDLGVSMPVVVRPNCLLYAFTYTCAGDNSVLTVRNKKLSSAIYSNFSQSDASHAFPVASRH